MGANKTQFRLMLNDINDRSIFVNWGQKERETTFNKLLTKMKLTEFAKLIDYDLPTLSEIKNGTVKPSGYVYVSLCKILNLNIDLKRLKISSRNHTAVRIVSLDIPPELMGLFHSDGILRKNNRSGIFCFFCNQNKQLIQRFKTLVNNSFDCEFSGAMDKRDGTYYVYPPSIIGRLLINRFGEKRGQFRPPNLSDQEIPDYIRGLFDGDGTILLQKTHNTICPRIRISMQHKIFAESIIHLLNRIGIYSRLQFETSNGNKWWDVDIARRESVLKFINDIGSMHPKKKYRMNLVKTCQVPSCQLAR